MVYNVLEDSEREEHIQINVSNNMIKFYEHRHREKKAAKQIYYAEHREDQITYYKQNRDEVCARQRACYHRKKADKLIEQLHHFEKCNVDFFVLMEWHDRILKAKHLEARSTCCANRLREERKAGEALATSAD